MASFRVGYRATGSAVAPSRRPGIAATVATVTVFVNDKRPFHEPHFALKVEYSRVGQHLLVARAVADRSRTNVDTMKKWCLPAHSL